MNAFFSSYNESTLGVPAGTDLEEFLWQRFPESRPEVEARNPGREFTAWNSEDTEPVKKEPLTWADIDEALKAGEVEGVPEGTDLEEFLWQRFPESRPEVEARNPGRKFKAWNSEDNNSVEDA